MATPPCRASPSLRGLLSGRGEANSVRQVEAEVGVTGESSKRLKEEGVDGVKGDKDEKHERLDNGDTAEEGP
jgi:hypothetical protein